MFSVPIAVDDGRVGAAMFRLEGPVFLMTDNKDVVAVFTDWDDAQAFARGRGLLVVATRAA